MIRIAQERVAELFSLAEQESRRGGSETPDRCVALARRIGTRYNVRFLPEYRDLYCRGCSAYWIEGRTVRTRLRGGHRSQTCLRCGRVRRVVLGARARPTSSLPPSVSRPAEDGVPALVGEDEEEPGSPADEGEEE